MDQQQSVDDRYDPTSSEDQTGPPNYQQLEPTEEVVQVVYQSNQNGSLVGVETSLIGGPCVAYDPNNYGAPMFPANGAPTATMASIQPRAASTLPSVAEESSSSALSNLAHEENLSGEVAAPLEIAPQSHEAGASDDVFNQSEAIPPIDSRAQYEDAPQYYNLQQQHQQEPTDLIYSTVNKVRDSQYKADPSLSQFTDSQVRPIDVGSNDVYPTANVNSSHNLIDIGGELLQHQLDDPNEELEQKENIEDINEEITQILLRQKQGAAESGSFRNHSKKKLGLSVSTNENDLTAYRQKLIESQESNTNESGENDSAYSSKFKRTHSVSFNVNSSRSDRHSVDIRNLPSYLAHKRASIVDVARGAMSSIMNSFASGGGSSISSQRRDSMPDDDQPIFEEPIAPTLSLGQRVALVRNSGAEFGTVGWIGQLPDVDDDWIVGVIFDNMIGDCDGAHNGVRYFYARENYAMFVPMTLLTKTDNYIGRPETGTMLSRMSVSLKPGQLISIQRSSIRLQHCFLNAPHQRVGHDVRAVSNRLHCQCHNCGPCAHLTKQGRVTALPHFGSHHLPHKNKNSLAHAAVEMLAHHHHHFHDEEEPEEENYKFGDNAAHACNYVRYSCCQQSGSNEHGFMNDCEMVRPELLDNLIHAPRAPHRRSRHRMRRFHNPQAQKRIQAPQQVPAILDADGKQSPQPLMAFSNQSTLETNATTKTSSFVESGTSRLDGSGSEGTYSSSRSSSPMVENQQTDEMAEEPAYNYYGAESSSNKPTSVYNTIDSQFSIMDQQRFIYQRDSSAFIHQSQPSNWSDDHYSVSEVGLGTKILRCFGCMRQSQGRHKRPKKRKLSARDRLMEYRRRQSTFVPSTLAKPHEDFASHGIIFPPPDNQNDANSDYSSYSKSSGSSRSSSPGNRDGTALKAEINQMGSTAYNPQTMSMEHGAAANNTQLKSVDSIAREFSEPKLDYNDYTFEEGYECHKKNECSCESDLGFSETFPSSSNDTLKSIVDQCVNEEVNLPPPITADDNVSPVLSSEYDNHNEAIEISSPTTSSVENVEDDEQVCSAVENLNLHEEDHTEL